MLHDFWKMNDIQLKQALAKMLPEKVTFCEEKSAGFTGLFWNSIEPVDPAITLSRKVLDTELLHLCWLVEETLTEDEFLFQYAQEIAQLFQGNPFLRDVLHLTWQQHVIALAKVKGISL